MEERMKPIEVSEILIEEFMKPLHISAYKLAKDIFVPVSRIQDILHNRRKISIDTSIRLGKYFGMDDLFFFRLQMDLDYRHALYESEKTYERIKTVDASDEYLNVKTKIEQDLKAIKPII